MPYFEDRGPTPPYWCRGCESWYIQGNISCCVVHSPGQCCHYGEDRVSILKIENIRKDLKHGSVA